MAGQKGEYRKLLERAIAAEAKRQKKTLLQHAVSLAYKDVTVLNTILRKVLPDLRSIDAKITSAGPFKLIIEVAERDNKETERAEQDTPYPDCPKPPIPVEMYERGLNPASRFKMNKRRKAKRKLKHTTKKETE